MITTDEVKQFKEVLYKMRDTLMRVEKNQEFDRRDFSEFANRLGHAETELRELRNIVLDLPRKTTESMDSVVDDIEKAAKGVEDAIVIKKTEVIDNQPRKKRKWYYLWLIKTPVKARNTH